MLTLTNSLTNFLGFSNNKAPKELSNSPLLKTQKTDTPMSQLSQTSQTQTANTTDNAKLLVKNLDFYYGDFHALKNVNLAIADKKVTAFIGPSGCGKSTLLRTFNRMYELYPNMRATGEILLDNENLLTAKDVNLLRARVGMVFQKPRSEEHTV